MAGKHTGIFEATSDLKILKFLCENTGSDFTGRDIQEVTGISRVGVFLSMRELISQGFAKKQLRGRMGIYSLDMQNSAVKQFKALLNIMETGKALGKLKPVSVSVTLYGSCARGEDTQNSDIDIFVITHDPENVKEVLSKIKLKRKLQAVIKTPVEMVVFREKETLYLNEVERGIKLWEERDKR
jgi:predicted nucleotidyltransferase